LFCYIFHVSFIFVTGGRRNNQQNIDSKQQQRTREFTRTANNNKLDGADTRVFDFDYYSIRLPRRQEEITK
jgi:hypothetical protein